MSAAAIDTRGRYRGCLVGGAIGDALGAPVELMSRDGILARFGPAGIVDFAPAYDRLGAITDDTQMTLFTAEALLRAARERDAAESNGSGVVPNRAVPGNRTVLRRELSLAYLRWLVTQGEPWPLTGDVPIVSLADVPLPEGLPNAPGAGSGLLADARLHARRGPGDTCLTALRATRELGAFADNDSKGCGGVMRTVPIGLYGHALGLSDDEIFAIGTDSAALTHGHAIERLGRGWVAEEALAIGLYCALVAKDFAQGVTLAVNHGGDSDSTGSIAGNLLGVMMGEAAIPARWRAGVELGHVVASMADALGELGEARWTIRLE